MCNLGLKGSDWTLGSNQGSMSCCSSLVDADCPPPRPTTVKDEQNEKTKTEPDPKSRSETVQNIIPKGPGPSSTSPTPALPG